MAYFPDFFWISDISYLDIAAEGRYYWGGHLRGFSEEFPIPESIVDKLCGPALSGFYAGVLEAFDSMFPRAAFYLIDTRISFLN